jgi:hypothetical protein
MIPPRDAQTALARHPMETDTSVAATELVLYVTYITWNIRSCLLMYISVKRSSARMESGLRFKTVAATRATVAPRAEPSARGRAEGVLRMGLEWYFDQSPAGTTGATWNDPTSTNLLTVLQNSAEY